MTIDEINKELREIDEYSKKVYLDMVYDEYELEMFENGMIRIDSDRFYDEDAIFYGKKA